MPEPTKRRTKFNSVNVKEVHSNVGQEIIEITSDKLQLILNSSMASMISRKEWQTPLSILITIILVLCTTDFKEFIGLKAGVWTAVFVISAVISAVWLILSLLNMNKAITVEDILNRVKNKD